MGFVADDTRREAGSRVPVTAASPAASSADSPLFARYPRLAERLPRLSFHEGASPVSRLPHISAALGRDDIWLKDDGVFGTVYGGNKPRKLQFVLADALRRGARRVLTTGTIGTNHGLATALYAREFGLETTLLISYEEPSPETVTTLLQIAESGAVIHYTRSYPLTALVAPYFIARYWRRDRRMPYLMGPGGSSPLAAVGYAEAAFELADQVRTGAMPEPRSIVIPLGTGGTVAGLLAGLRLAGLDSQVIAVKATRAPTTWRPYVARLARSVCRLIADRGRDPEAARVRLDNWRIEPGWVGPGFGRESAAGSDARIMVEDLEGMDLDPVYTAKSMAALIDLSRAGALNGPVLFWHTHNSIPLPDPDASAVSTIPQSLRRVCRL
jgi:D-cysteine desulfhydrase